MPNTKYAARTICPYFIRETGKAIYCEGVIPGSTTVSRFERPEDKVVYQERVCACFKYGSLCPLAEKIGKRY